MGGSSFSAAAYRDIASSQQTKTQAQVFKQNGIHPDMDPKGINFRESRDSVAHPESLAIIFGLDETGSMGMIPEMLVKHKLGSLMETLINHGVEDASVCFVGVGDHYCDNSPLQVGQFEAGAQELNEWLTKIHIERGGGGNGGESYMLPWLFGARHTSTDNFEKRGIKGFIFTIGDEPVHSRIEAAFLKNYMGYAEASDLSTISLLEEARKSFHVFHINLDSRSQPGWQSLMGENVIFLADPMVVAETVATTVAMVQGATLANVVKSFDSATGGKVGTALATISQSLANVQHGGIAKTGVIEL